MPAALALDAVTRRHAGASRPAVDALTLDVRPGELVALLGASGSGKSTTLRVAAGYEAPDAGRVLLDGRDVTMLPPERRGLGMVFQHHALFPHLSVEENVAFGLEARGVARAERRARARAALAGVGLDGAGPRAVQALSGGERQRVAIARALVVDPRVLLLDEPFASLDPALRVALRDDLRALLGRAHVAALLVTHDREDAFAVADRIALLDEGRLLQAGTPETLYDTPADARVARALGPCVLLPATLGDDAGAAPHVRVAVGGVAQCARVRGAPPATPDRATLAVVRPEHLALAADDAGEGWPGRVAARRFAGGTIAVRVTLADGTGADLALPARDPHAASLREGDVVRVRLVADAVALVPDGTWAVAGPRPGPAG